MNQEEDCTRIINWFKCPFRLWIHNSTSHYLQFYEQHIENFYAFGDSNGFERDSTGYFLGAEENLNRYFEYSHLLLLNEENKPRYAPTTMRTWYSMFQKYWLHNAKEDLHTKVPIIDSDLIKWPKGYEETKANKRAIRYSKIINYHVCAGSFFSKKIIGKRKK